MLNLDEIFKMWAKDSEIMILDLMKLQRKVHHFTQNI